MKLKPPTPFKLALILALSAPLSSAQTAAPDIARGFELLFELGLPDVSGPEWQYVPVALPRHHGLDPSWFSSQTKKEPPATTALNNSLAHGWVEDLPAPTPTPTPSSNYLRILIDGWRMQRIPRYPSPSPASSATTPPAAAEKADASALAFGMQVLVSSEKHARQSLVENPDQLLSYLFRAAHYHRRGHQEEAADAAQALFALVPRQDRLIDLAMDRLANARYDEIIQRFQRDADWAQLDAGLTQLLTLYQRGWMNRPLVDKLHRLVLQRRASPQPPALAQASLLTPGQQAWWIQLDAPSRPAGKETTSDDSPHGPWSFDLTHFAQHWLYGQRMQVEPSGYTPWQDASTSAPAWARAIQEQDEDWIRVLAAGVGDETLITPAIVWANIFDSPTAFDLESDPPVLNAAETAALWRKVNRPSTRDDLARAFLQAVLPHHQAGDSLPTDPAELRQAALDLATALKGKSPREVARFYLQRGTPEQQTYAMAALTQRGDDADLQRVVARILEHPLHSFEEATLMAHRLDKGALPFLNQFRQALWEKEVRNGNTDANPEKGKLPESTRKQLALVESIASGRDPAAMVQEFLEGKISRSELADQLHLLSDFRTAGNLQVVDAILQGVTRLPKGDGDRKCDLLRQCLPFVKWPTKESHKAALRKILQDDPDAPVTGMSDTVHPLSHDVYWMADYLAHKFRAEGVHLMVDRFDSDELWPLWIARGRAALEGTPVPPSPDTANVPTARRQAMRQALDQHLEKGWPQYVQSLSIEEKLTLDEELRATPFKPAWRQLALRVTEVQARPEALSHLEVVKACLGQPVNAASLVQLSEACRKHLPLLEPGQGVRCSIRPRDFLQGLRLTITIEPAGKGGYSTLTRAGEWMKQLRTVNGYAWLNWQSFDSSFNSANWHLDPDNQWQNWPTLEHPVLGSAPNRGTPIAGPDLIELLEKRIKSLDPSSSSTGLYLFETGAVKPAARDTPD